MQNMKQCKKVKECNIWELE